MLKIKNVILSIVAMLTISTTAYANETNQIDCMARNAVYEAGNQGDRGMIAVTQVVMNRTRDDRFPSTPCGVIHQKRGKVCQFSWVCQRRLPFLDADRMRRARQIAQTVYLARIYDVTFGALFYHANYVRPRWAYVFKRTTVIGDHIFYKG